MKAALTSWDGRISPVFDVSREAVLLTIRAGGVTERRCVSIEAPDCTRKVERLVALEVETLICGAITEALRLELVSLGIRVIGFVAGELGEVEAALLAGRLPTPALSMPGCCARRRRCRGGRQTGGPGRCAGQPGPGRRPAD